jgi:LuxR family transcriptional regulator, maltose regulon positive regulatory protein
MILRYWLLPTPTGFDTFVRHRAPPAVRACHCTLVAVRVTSSTGAFPLGDFTNQARGRVAALEPEPTSPRAALLRFGLGSGLYLSGESSAAREQFEAAVESAKVGQPFLRMISLSILSIVTTDEGRLEEAKSLAREARTLVESFGLQGVPQSSWVRIALGYMLARQGNLAEAQTELENALFARSKLPGLSPGPFLIGLLALASVRSVSGERRGARAALDEPRSILESFCQNTGILSELLERQERRLPASKPREGQLDGDLTKRELDVLGLLVGEMRVTQSAQSLYVGPSTVRTQINSVYRKLGVSSRDEAMEEARARGSSSPHQEPVNPLGETC